MGSQNENQSPNLHSKILRRLQGYFWQTVAPARTVREIFDGKQRPHQNRKLCLFSTFDPGGRVDPYVQAYIKEISNSGFDVIVIATGPELVEQDYKALRPFVRAILLRKNVGLDFGSWRAATQHFPDWKSYESLLLTNDSVYGPLRPLKEILEECTTSSADMIGMTDSNEIAYHLQSYFLYIKQNILHSDAFERYLKSIRLHWNKSYIIERFEVGLSRALREAGFKIEALFPTERIENYTLRERADFPFKDKLTVAPLNQTLYFWGDLIKEYRFPFVKTEILKANRMGLPEIKYWRALVSRERPEWCDLIENHLKRVYPNAVGLRH